MIPAIFDLNVIQGDEVAIPFRLYRPDGFTPMGVKKRRLRAELRDPTGTQVARFKRFYGTERGNAALVLDAKVSSGLPIGWYGMWSAEITLPDGAVATVVCGAFKVTGIEGA